MHVTAANGFALYLCKFDKHVNVHAHFVLQYAHVTTIYNKQVLETYRQRKNGMGFMPKYLKCLLYFLRVLINHSLLYRCSCLLLLSFVNYACVIIFSLRMHCHLV